MIRSAPVVASLLGLLVACTTANDAAGSSSGLAGSTWHLAELRSNDDAIGVVRPGEPTKYEMRLGANGEAAFRLDCNRATGRWQSTQPNQVKFSPLAMTRAMCPSGSLDTRVARELAYVRTYVIEGDRLVLNMIADGGSQVWVRPSD